MKQLPENPDWGHLRGQAKSLLKSWLVLNPADPRRLADAQHSVAQDYGFLTWAELKKHVEGIADSRLPIDDWVKKAMTQRVVGPPPEGSTHGSFVVALCVADIEAVRGFLVKEPGLAHQKSGVFGCDPLCYVCGSLAKGGDRLAVARLLIEFWCRCQCNLGRIRIGPALPLTPLFGACGKQCDATLAKMLLEAGGES